MLSAERDKTCVVRRKRHQGERFTELGEYNILGEVTVYFGNGKVHVEQQYWPQLLNRRVVVRILQNKGIART